MIEVSCAIILNSNQQVLVTQRSSQMSHPLQWEFPGGKIEENETAEECLIREIREELNIDIEITSGLSPKEHRYPDKVILLIPFICQCINGEILLKEHSDYQWVNIQNLPNLNWVEADIVVMKEFLNQVK